MKNMFYNYDNKVILPDDHQNVIPDTKTIMGSDPYVEKVFDIKGNELGISAKQAHAFNLYFTLDTDSCYDQLASIVYGSQIIFEVLETKQHNVILTKTFTPEESYFYDVNTIEVSVTQAESEQLDIDSYNMRLTLVWAGGKYEVFSETDGQLIIR